MWVDPDEDPRESVDAGTGERAVLAGYLDRYRLTLEMKCQGLNPEQLARRSVAPSTMSLLGLVRHLARVEHSWFRRFIEGQRDVPRLYDSSDDPDFDFDGALADDEVVNEAWYTWRSEVAHSREVYATLEDLGVRPTLRPCRPAPRANRRPHRSIANGCEPVPRCDPFCSIGRSLGAPVRRGQAAV